MEIYLAQQTIAFLWAIVIGAALALLYDMFRILRIAIPFGPGLIALQDILFFTVCAVVTFLFLLSQAEGKVRAFLLLGEFLGAVVYFCTISIPIMGVSRKIIAVIRGFFSFVFRWFLLPLWRLSYWIITTFLRPPRFMLKILKKACIKMKFSLLKVRGVLYNQVNRIIQKRNRDEAGEETV
jgi:spore cortex biosynthesis protein YabQ